VKPAILQVLLINYLYLMTGAAVIALGVLNSDLLMPPWGWALKFALGIITWFFIARDLPKGRVLPVFLGANFLIILVWPWSPLRFLIPILPFLLAYLLFGLWKLANKMPLSFYARGLALFALVVVLAINLMLFVRINNQNHDKHYPFWYQNKELASWASYAEVFTWLKQNTRPTDVIASGLDSMIFLYTGRQAFRPFQGRPTSLFYGQQAPALGTWEEVSGLMERYQARYFVQLPMPGFAEEKPLDAVIKELQKRRPGWLQPVYVGPDNRFTIFAIGSDTKPSHSHLK
jgi:hypothetical protein